MFMTIFAASVVDPQEVCLFKHPITYSLLPDALFWETDTNYKSRGGGRGISFRGHATTSLLQRFASWLRTAE